jgi:hypothetical protein
VLLLPQTMCISPEERDVLTAFVQAGGVLMTDRDVGERDGHGNLYKDGPVLDKLFGFRREPGDVPSGPAKLSPTADAGPMTKKYSAQQMTAAKSGFILNGAKPWLQSEDGAPVVLVNQVGQGKAVYLNIDLSNYATSTSSGVAGEVTVESHGAGDYTRSCVELLRAVLADCAGVNARATALVDGKILTDARTFYYSGDGLDLIAVQWRNGMPAKIGPQDAIKATFKLPRKAYVYELRVDPKYLGEADEVKATAMPCMPDVFALLPYRVDKVEMDAPAKAKGGDVVTITGRIVPQGDAQPVLHVVRFEAFRPEGTRFDGFCANLLAKAGQFTCSLPLALDEQPGAWKIVATDVISRKAAEATIRIAP